MQLDVLSKLKPLGFRDQARTVVSDGLTSSNPGENAPSPCNQPPARAATHTRKKNVGYIGEWMAPPEFPGGNVNARAEADPRQFKKEPKEQNGVDKFRIICFGHFGEYAALSW